MNKVQLSQICEVKKGQTITKKTITEGNIPVIAGGQQPAYYHNEPNRTGDVITVSGSGAYAGFVNFFTEPIFASDCTTIQSLDENKALTRYVFYLLKGLQEYIYSMQRGAGQPHVYPKDLVGIEIPLAPLPVQQQIVSILEKAENLKLKRNETNKETQKIIQSLFYEMFGDPVKNEKGWDVKTISEIGEVISGSTPKTSNKEYWNGEVNWITPAELIDGDNYYYYETERKISQAGLNSIGNRLFPVGTVMLTTRAPIGKVAIAGSEMCSNQGFKNIICNDKLIHPVYLYVWLLTRKDYLNSIGTGATFKEISKKTVETVSLSVPPLQLQEEFAKKVQLIESIQSKQQSSTEEINTLFDALMQKAFKGELAE